MALLYTVQFLSWSGMFCLWIYALPVIAMILAHHAGTAPDAGSLEPGTAAFRRVLLTVGGCYAFYAFLGTSLAFLLPALTRRLAVRWIYGAGLIIGGIGIAVLGLGASAWWLLPCFMAIGVSWACIGNMPYAIVAAVAPQGRGAHYLRLFGYSTVIPQIIVTIALAIYGGAFARDGVRYVMLMGGGLTVMAGLLIIGLGRGLVIGADEW